MTKLKKMNKRKIKRKREDLHKVRDFVKKEKEAIEKALPPIVRDTGGSINKIENKSLYFKGWVKNHQDINPLIGKHVTEAPEYSTECLILDQNVGELDDVMKKTLEQGAAEYNPDIDNSTEAEDLTDSPKICDNKDEKFIDINIIENATKRLANSTDETIKNSVIEQMKSFHDNPKYETEIDVEKRIKSYRDILRFEKSQEKKLLDVKKNDSDDDLDVSVTSPKK